jgi:HEPN domain-containing protein
MNNPDLARDYRTRAAVRLRALDVLYDGESWADVVREAQEVVELALKGLLRGVGIDVPRVHDVSAILKAERARLPEELLPHLDELAESSRRLRRDRELAFYGAEDLTPSEFYLQSDADAARTAAQRVVALLNKHYPV